jgi:hypothetical protein
MMLTCNFIDFFFSFYDSDWHCRFYSLDAAQGDYSVPLHEVKFLLDIMRKLRALMTRRQYGKEFFSDLIFAHLGELPRTRTLKNHPKDVSS